MATQTANGTNGMIGNLKALIDAAEKAKNQPNFESVEVVREGQKIIIPEGMDYDTARKWLTEMEVAEETVVNIRHEIEAFPHDGALALAKAMKQLYGFTRLSGGFFDPPSLISVRTGPGIKDVETAMWGRLTPPGMDGFIQTSMDWRPRPKFVISGKIKKKFESHVRMIAELTEHFVKEQSVYKGKAIRVDLGFVDNGFSSLSEVEPKFMDVADVKRGSLILSRSVEFELDATVFNRIAYTDKVRKAGVPIKHGVLLEGPYGTGKTLTARTIAAECVKNGWTFIYLEDVRHLDHAIRMSQLYSPCVLFAEDIDRATGGERTTQLDELLNTLDGVDTKTTEVVTILTTNHVGNINRAMMRPGRIDTLISMGYPDAEAAQRFVRVYGAPHVSDAVITDGVGKAYEGMAPAAIAEGVHKAKMATLARKGELADGGVGEDELLDSAVVMRKHQDVVNAEQEQTDFDRLSKGLQVVGDALFNSRQRHEEVIGAANAAQHQAYQAWDRADDAKNAIDEVGEVVQEIRQRV